MLGNTTFLPLLLPLPLPFPCCCCCCCCIFFLLFSTIGDPPPLSCLGYSLKWECSRGVGMAFMVRLKSVISPPGVPPHFTEEKYVDWGLLLLMLLLVVVVVVVGEEILEKLGLV